jgi:hypothetical protein
MAGAPAWLPFVAPLVALATTTLWLRAPGRRRDPLLRGALMASVALAGLEMLVVALVAGMLFLFSLSGGIEDF